MNDTTAHVEGYSATPIWDELAARYAAMRAVAHDDGRDQPAPTPATVKRKPRRPSPTK
jgi:hypothetical protein